MPDTSGVRYGGGCTTGAAACCPVNSLLVLSPPPVTSAPAALPTGNQCIVMDSIAAAAEAESFGIQGCAFRGRQPYCCNTNLLAAPCLPDVSGTPYGGGCPYNLEASCCPDPTAVPASPPPPPPTTITASTGAFQDFGPAGCSFLETGDASQSFFANCVAPSYKTECCFIPNLSTNQNVFYLAGNYNLSCLPFPSAQFPQGCGGNFMTSCCPTGVPASPPPPPPTATPAPVSPTPPASPSGMYHPMHRQHICAHALTTWSIVCQTPTVCQLHCALPMIS